MNDDPLLLKHRRRLNQRERLILRHRRLGVTLEVIGTELGVTRQRVSTMEMNALRKLGWFARSVS